MKSPLYYSVYTSNFHIINLDVLHDFIASTYYSWIYCILFLNNSKIIKNTILLVVNSFKHGKELVEKYLIKAKCTYVPSLLNVLYCPNAVFLNILSTLICSAHFSVMIQTSHSFQYLESAVQSGSKRNRRKSFQFENNRFNHITCTSRFKCFLMIVHCYTVLSQRYVPVVFENFFFKTFPCFSAPTFLEIRKNLVLFG